MGLGAVAAGVGAVGSIAGGLISSSAASSAADKQSAAANRAADMTAQQQAQIREDLAPYRDLGTGGINKLLAQFPQLSSQFGGKAPDRFSFNPTQAEIENTPGYQFTRDQGLRAVQSSASAKGLGVSGAAQKAAAQYATGLADSTWKDVFNAKLGTYNADLSGYKTDFDIDQANKTNAFNKLMGLVGAGQSSAAQTGAFGSAATQNAGNFLTSGANAQASGIVGGANALSSGISNLGNSGTNALLLNRLLGQQGGGNGEFSYSGKAYSGGGSAPTFRA